MFESLVISKSRDLLSYRPEWVILPVAERDHVVIVVVALVVNGQMPQRQIFSWHQRCEFAVSPPRADQVICSKLAPSMDGGVNEMIASTSRHRPRLAEADRQPRSSPSRTAQELPGRSGPLVERELGQRRIPVDLISMKSNGASCGMTHQRLVTNELSCKPEERLLEVVVGLGGNVVVLEVLLAVESDGPVSYTHLTLPTKRIV